MRLRQGGARAQGRRVNFETVRVPLSAEPEHREEIVRLTGQPKVPVLLEDDGRAMHDSKRIIEHIRAGPPPAA